MASADLPARLRIPPADRPLHTLRARNELGELLVGELRRTVRHEDDLEELLRDLDPYLP